MRDRITLSADHLELASKAHTNGGSNLKPANSLSSATLVALAVVLCGQDAVSQINRPIYADSYPSIQAAHDALPAGGGKILLPCGDYPFTGLVITKPTILEGCGGSIGGNNGQRPPTRMIYTGSSIAIDIGPQAKD